MKKTAIISFFVLLQLLLGNEKIYSRETTTPSAFSILALRSEYEAVGQLMYDINDAQEGNITYAIASGNNQNYYSINSGTGEITIANAIPDIIGTTTKHILEITAGSNNYIVTIADGLDYTIEINAGRYTILDDDGEAFVDPASQWTVVNNLWGRGTAVPNVDFRIVTLYKPSLPDSTIFLWDVPGNASLYGGASVWCFVNTFWGNRNNVRENLPGFPFKIADVGELALDFDFQKLYGDEGYKVALNTFLTNESFLTNFSSNDGDFFFVFDQKENFIPAYPVSLPDTVIEGKTFARLYKNDETGYEWRRVIIKDGERYLTGSLDLKKVFEGFINRGYINPQQYIYHLQLGLEITNGFGGMRFNKSIITTCTPAAITSVTASNTGPLCSGQTTNLTANGVGGTNAVVTWWTGPNGTGANLGTGTTLNGVGANTYYARITGNCGIPTEASITVNSIVNTFSGTGNWTDNARWSCGVPPTSGDAVTLAAGANVTLNTNFIVGGSLTMNATSTLIVNPTRTLSVDVGAIANFNGQAVTFKSDATGTASLGQVNGILAGATNVTVERFISNNGFRSWRLLSVPTFGNGQTIRQAWQEGDANPLPQQNNVANFGTQITGVFPTQAAAAAAGFDSTSVQAGMLGYTGSAWANVTNTNQPIANNKSWFLYVRGERSKTVTGLTQNTSATTLRTRGTVYTGDQLSSVAANAFGLIPNLYPSAISFTGLTRTGGVNNLFYIWDSKKLNGNSLGVYQTFSATNNFNCLINGGSYTLGQPNTTIESGQSFFVAGGAAAGTITLKESAKISGTNGSLGFRPVAQSKIDTRLYSGNAEMLDANTVVFDKAYNKAVSGEDAPKLGNPGANFAIETDGKLLAIEGTKMAEEGDVIQFRMWNMYAGTYKLEFAANNLAIADGLIATVEDSYLKTTVALSLTGNTTVTFTVGHDAGSAAANRFRIVFRKAAAPAEVKQGYNIAPNPVTNGVINLQFNAQPDGRYSVRVTGINGQLIVAKQINHAGGTATKSITIGSLNKGTYQVEIIAPNKTRTIKPLIISGN